MERKWLSRIVIALALMGALFVGSVQAADMPDVANRTASELEDQPSKVITSYYEETEYVVGGETQFTYTEDGNVQEEISLYYTDGVPENSTRTTHVYDEQGNELSSMEYQWIEGAWAEYTRETYTYSESVLTQVITEMTDGSMWAPIYKSEYFYLDAVTTRVLWSMHDGSDWYPSSEYTKTINSNGDPTEVLSGTYYEGVLNESSREVYEYNPNGTLATGTMYNRSSDSDPWEVHTLIECTYDGLGRMTAEYMSMRSWETSEMVQNHRTTFTYDDQGRMAETEMFFRETEDDPWAPGSKEVYVYDGDTAVENDDAPEAFALLQNSPNPFNPATVIPFTIDRAGVVTLEVFAATGQKVATLIDGPLDAGFHQSTWDASGLATGMYISRLTVNGRAMTAKMLLVK